MISLLSIVHSFRNRGEGDNHLCIGTEIVWIDVGNVSIEVHKEYYRDDWGVPEDLKFNGDFGEQKDCQNLFYFMIDLQQGFWPTLATVTEHRSLIRIVLAYPALPARRKNPRPVRGTFHDT